MSNNKQRGNNWERQCVNSLKNIGFSQLATSREISKERDDAKVDIMNRNELENGVFPIHIQCKNQITKVDYPKILAEMPKGDKVIWHKLTEKRGNIFREKNRYVIMEEPLFLKLMQLYRDEKFTK